MTCGTTEGLADALRAKLALRPWTDRELARRVGKSHSTLGHYLRGERPFPDDLLVDLTGSATIDAVTALIDAPLEDQAWLARWFTKHWRRASSHRARRRVRGRWSQYKFADAGIVAHHKVGKSATGWLLVEFRAFDESLLGALTPTPKGNWRAPTRPASWLTETLPNRPSQSAPAPGIPPG